MPIRDMLVAVQIKRLRVTCIQYRRIVRQQAVEHVITNNQLVELPVGANCNIQNIDELWGDYAIKGTAGDQIPSAHLNGIAESRVRPISEFDG